MQKERVMIFIDGSNLYHSLKNLNLKINFEDLIKILTKDKYLVKIFYYTAPLDITIDKEKYWRHQRFLERLRKIPNFNVILCNLRKVINKDGSIDFYVKGDDIHLANDLLKGAFKNEFDEAIIVSGDEDFIPAIKTVKELNKKVINAYFPTTSSYVLRRVCDKSINLKRELTRQI